MYPTAEVHGPAGHGGRARPVPRSLFTHSECLISSESKYVQRIRIRILESGYVAHIRIQIWGTYPDSEEIRHDAVEIQATMCVHWDRGTGLARAQWPRRQR